LEYIHEYRNVKNVYGIIRVLQDMRSTLFWSSLVIGFFIVYLFYTWEKTKMKKEHFQTAPVKPQKSADYNEMTNTATNFASSFPSSDKLYSYL